MANFNININEYICPTLTVTIGNTAPCLVEILVNKDDALSDYKLYANGVLLNITPTIVGSQYKYVFTNLQESSYMFKVVANCTVRNTYISSNSINFVPNQLPNNTDVYAFFDQTSMMYEDAVSASAALNNWFTQYKIDNSDYQGNLYIIPSYSERYVGYLGNILNGSVDYIDYGNWGDIAILPPGWNTLNWTPPSDVLLLAFVDETHSSYHSDKVSDGFYNNVIQPTSAYKDDFYTFKNFDRPSFNFFRGVVYPIVQDIQGLGGALVLQLAAAMKARRYTQAEINELNTAVDVSVLLTNNPYQNVSIPGNQDIEGLEKFNWIGVYDKTSPASAVFNSSTFASELNDIITENNQECS